MTALLADKGLDKTNKLFKNQSLLDEHYGKHGQEICKQGLLEIVKDKLTKKIFICCDECEAEWNNPEDALKGINGTRNKHGEIEYPNIEDILREKWSVSINEHHN